jgi:FdrA protein
MAFGYIIRQNQYFDSLFLMGVNKKLLDQPGVKQTAVLMGSPANKTLLADIGVVDVQIDAAGPNDLVVAVIAESQQVIDQILGKFDLFLETASEGKPVSSLRTLKDGLTEKPNANLAVISLPGEYAAHEALKALEAGLHVFLFSDNVSLEDELELKTLAAQKGLLVMGPDCGTSVINGKGLGFSNVICKGRIGVFGPAGTDCFGCLESPGS